MAALPQGNIVVQSSAAARRLLFHLHSIGDNPFPCGWGIEAFKKPGATLGWVRQGRGRLMLGDTPETWVEWKLQPAPVFWLYGLDRARLYLPDPGHAIILSSIRFGGPGLENWLEELDAKRRPQFYVRTPQRIFAAYRAMHKLARWRPPNWELAVHDLLSSILKEFVLSRNIFTPHEAATPLAVMRVLNAIDSDPARNWKAADLAVIAGMSYRAFGTLFHNAMREAPHAYIQRIRLDLARRKLADERLLIKQIANDLHFANKHYFTTFFHKHAGISPTQFRQVIRKSAQAQTATAPTPPPTA